MKLIKYGYPIILCLFVMGIGACNKSGDAKPKIKGQAKLNVINLVTDIRGIDFYLNGTRQNTTSAIYLYNASGYLSVDTVPRSNTSLKVIPTAPCWQIYRLGL